MDEIFDSGSFLLRSSTALDNEAIKEYIKRRISKNNATISLPQVEKIDQDTYLARGGNDTNSFSGMATKGLSTFKF